MSNVSILIYHCPPHFYSKKAQTSDSGAIKHCHWSHIKPRGDSISIRLLVALQPVMKL